MNKKGLFITLGVVSICCLTPCISAYVLFLNKPLDSAKQIANRAEAYRQAGLPWTQADLRPETPIPDDQNAAPQIKEFEKTWSDSGLSKNFPSLLDALKAHNPNKAATILKKCEPAVNAAKLASKKPYMDFHHDWDRGALLKLPEFAKLKEAIKLLTASAQVNQLNGNSQAALSDLEAAVRLANLCADEPTVIGNLVTIAGIVISLDAYEKVATMRQAQNRPVTDLIASLENTKYNIDFQASLRMEAYMSLATLRNMHHYGGLLNGMTELASGEIEIDVADADLVRDGYPKGILERAVMSDVMEYWIENYPAAQTDDLDILAYTKKLDQDSEDKATSGSITEKMMSLFYPVFGQYGIAIVRVDAVHQLNLAYLYALEYQRKNRKMPSTTEFLPKDFIDPFTKAPYKITNTMGNWRIYSLGPNQTDEKGLSRSEWTATGATTTSDDIIVPRPPN